MNINILQNGGGKNLRQSNMEALRIVAMSMILIHHFMVHGLTSANIPYHLFNLLNGFVYSGVNIFFLLSGYFTIRFSFKGLIRLAIMIAFFGTINLILLSFAGETQPPLLWITTIIYPVTKSPYWFMKVYVLLYISAPIINSGLQNMGKQQLRITLIIFLFVVFHTMTTLIHCTYLQGAYLYCTGYYIARYRPFSQVAWGWWLSLSILIVSLSGAIDWGMSEIYCHDLNYFKSYSSVFIFVSAVSLVMCFRNFSFKNNIINSLASASLGCYLLQDGLFGHKWLYAYQQKLLIELGYSSRLFLIFGCFFLAFWVASWILTKFMGLWLPRLSRDLANIIRSVVKRIWPGVISAKS